MILKRKSEYYRVSLYELEPEDKEFFGTDYKYFMTNGVIGLFDNNMKMLYSSFHVMNKKL